MAQVYSPSPGNYIPQNLTAGPTLIGSGDPNGVYVGLRGWTFWDEAGDALYLKEGGDNTSANWVLSGGGAVGAPAGAQFVTLALDGTLTAERVLTGTANQVTVTDGGANNPVTLSLPQSIATTSTPQFARLGLGAAADAATTMLNAGASVVSAPSHRMTGAWFTGGSATTTKPHFLIEPTGTTSTAWSTAGTGLGINAPSGFAGNLIDLQIVGVNALKLTTSGGGTLIVPFAITTSYLTASANIIGSTDASALIFGVSADTWLRRDAANILAQRNGTAAQRLRVYNTFTTVETSGEWFTIDWQSTANVCKLWTVKGSGAGTGRDLMLGADSTELLRFQTGSKIGFFGVTPVVRASAYTPTNATTDRSWDCNATTVDELADVVATLAADLQAYGLLQ